MDLPNPHNSLLQWLVQRRERGPFGANEVRGDLGWGFLGGAIWRRGLPSLTHPCVRKPRKHLAAGLSPPACLHRGIQPWLGAVSTEGREDIWADLSDVVECLVNYPWSCPPLALSVLSLTYFLASLGGAVCYLQEDGSKLMCWLALYSFSRIFLMMETEILNSSRLGVLKL